MNEGKILPIRLQYELFNLSVKECADLAELTEDMIQVRINRDKWLRLFPNIDFSGVNINKLISGTEELTDEDNSFALEIEQFTEFCNKVMQVYNLRKTQLLQAMYAELEAKIVEKAIDALNDYDTDIRGISSLAKCYKDLTNDIHQLLSKSLVIEGSNGVPSLIIKDLSGNN